MKHRVEIKITTCFFTLWPCSSSNFSSNSFIFFLSAKRNSSIDFIIHEQIVESGALKCITSRDLKPQGSTDHGT